jgi:hypothetical protein
MITTSPSLISVYDGRTCLGFVLKRANGFEAFDAQERSLGVFSNLKAAADIISKHTVPDISNQIADAFAGLRRDVRGRLQRRS